MVLVEDQKRTTPRYWSGLIDLSVIPLSGEATEINQLHLNVMGVFDCGVGGFFSIDYIVFYPQNLGDEGLYNLMNWEQLMSHHFKEFHLFPGISHAQLRQVAPLFEYENVEYLISVLEGKTDEAEFLQSIEDT
jgi:hypothetical protein